MEQKPEAGDASDATVPPVFADIRRAIEDIRNAIAESIRTSFYESKKTSQVKTVKKEEIEHDELSED